MIDERSEGGFAELREMRAGFAEVRADVCALQRQLVHTVAAFAITLLGVVAAGIVAAF